ALPVDDRIVRRVGAFVRRDTRLQVARDAGLGRVDDGPDFLGVALVQQTIERILHKVRIAQVAVAIDVRMAHGFDLIVHRLRGTKTQIFERITLEDIEDLADHHAARARRRRRHDVIAAVVAFDRRQLAHLVLLQIRLGDDALARGARGRDGIGDRTLVEGNRALLRNQAQRLRQVLLHQSIPGLVGLALVQEDGRGRRVVAKVIVRRGEQCDVAGVEHESALGKTNGRRDQRAARTRAILFPSVFEPGYAARYAHGQVAFRARALDDIAGAIEVPVGRGRERRLFAKVEKCLAPIGQLDGHEAPNAQVAGGRVDYGHRITNG